MPTKLDLKRKAAMEKAARMVRPIAGSSSKALRTVPMKVAPRPPIEFPNPLSKFNGKLEPCPFCANYLSVLMETGFAEYKYVRCHNHKCKAHGPRGETVEEAAAKWNVAPRKRK
jgi:hypothetical protein